MGNSSVQQQSKKPPVPEDIKKMFEDELFADFELRCSDGETLKCHKVILAIRSPVFHAMLSNDMKETQQGFVDVPDFTSIVLKEVLRYIYCGSVVSSENIFEDLIFAAEKYDIGALKEICIKEITRDISKANVFQCLLIADRISGCEKVFEESIKVIGG